MNNNISIPASSNPFTHNQIVYDTRLAGNRDIVKTIEKALPGAIRQTKSIAPQFLGKNITDTCSNLWYWGKSYIDYEKDDDHHQIVKYPSKLLSDRSGDCKSLALFPAAILKNLNIPFVFTYINQDGDSVPKHVYITAYDERNTPIYIDIVHNKFNEEPDQIKFKKNFNYDTMRISAIAGLTDKNYQHPYTQFLNEKIAGIYGSDDLFSVDTLEDAAAAFVSSGTDVKADISLAKKLAKYNPFGAPAVSTKENELFVESSPNSNNLFRLVYTGFRPTTTLSNAYAFANIVPDTKAALQAYGVTGSALDWNFHQYTINDIFNKVGGDWSGFLAKVKAKYGGSDKIINGAQYEWEVKAFADLVNGYKGNVDAWLSQFGSGSFSLVSKGAMSAGSSTGSGSSGNKASDDLPADNTMKYIAYTGLGLAALGAIIYAATR